ncbi:MAG: sulfite reductase subunit C [Eubacterium sp.]
MDINTKKLKKNAFRVSKYRGMTASRVRVPGGYLNADLLGKIQEIAEIYGNGTVHLTTRQGFEIPGIKLEDMDAVNARLQPIIDALGINQEIPGKGYTSSGTRNISACIGSNVCPYACYNTTNFAKKIEKEIFPNDLHFKIALTGCPNDCMKVRMHDFGIMGMTEPQYSKDKCVSCNACVKACSKKSTGALTMENYKITRDENLCIGCGECVLACPVGAWRRSTEKYYRLTLMGRTGKKNPRLGEDFILWADEDSIIKIILNTYDYVKQYIDLSSPGGKEHIGYIIDRTGFDEWKKWALKDVNLPKQAVINERLYWSGIKYAVHQSKQNV